MDNTWLNVTLLDLIQDGDYELTEDKICNTVGLWSTEYLSTYEVVSKLNDVSNAFPVTIGYLIKAMYKCSAQALYEDYELGELLGLIISMRDLYINEPYQLGNFIKSSISRIGSIGDITNSKPEDFGVYYLSKGEHLLSNLKDYNSVYYDVFNTVL